jgi:mRNA interferase MazF
MDLNKGDIVGINLNPKKGDEVGKVRPCIIISDNESNQILDTIIVVPLSTQLIDNMSPYRLRLKKRDQLDKDSDILINHIRTISKKRVTSPIGKITINEYTSIIENLCKNFI